MINYLPCSLEPTTWPHVPAEPDAIPVLLGLDVVLVDLGRRHLCCSVHLMGSEMYKNYI